MAYSKTIEDFFEKNKSRKEELDKLRKILTDLPFEESIKWGMPSYAVNGSNAVGIGSFKNWSCLWFHQGVFLKDDAKVLVNAQEGKTSGMRQWRFKNLEEINKKVINEYLLETIENHKAGKKIQIAKKAITSKERIPLPPLLDQHLIDNPKHKDQFSAYTLSQQNEFSNYIIEAKRQSTKENRLEKIKQIIEDGKTLKVLWGQ